MTWTEKAELLSKLYCSRGVDYGLEWLNDAERVFFCALPFIDEMNDGGFWAFFYNSTGAFTCQTVNALKRLGAHRSAELLTQAVPIYFGPHDVPEDTGARRRLMDDVDGDHTPEANRVHDLWSDSHEEITPRLEAFAEANWHQLRFTEEEAGTATLLGDGWRQCPACSDAWQEDATEPMSTCPTCGRLTLVRD